jgi:hypothetical protein
MTPSAAPKKAHHRGGGGGGASAQPATKGDVDGEPVHANHVKSSHTRVIIASVCVAGGVVVFFVAAFVVAYLLRPEVQQRYQLASTAVTGSR